MRESIRAERTLRDAEWRPDRASAEAARGCIRFRQEPDTRTGVSSLDTPALSEYYSIRGDLTTPQSILPRSIASVVREGGHAQCAFGPRPPSPAAASLVLSAAMTGPKASTPAIEFGRSWTWSSSIPRAA